MFCSKCGQKLKEGTNFCTRCGFRQTTVMMEQAVAEKATEEAAVSPEETQAAENVNAEAASDTEVATVDTEEKATETDATAADNTDTSVAVESSADDTVADAEPSGSAEEAKNDADDSSITKTESVIISRSELAKAGSEAAMEMEKRVRDAEEAAERAKAEEAAAAAAAEREEKKKTNTVTILVAVAAALVVLIVFGILFLPSLLNKGRDRDRDRDREEEAGANVTEPEEEPPVVEEEPAEYLVNITAFDTDGNTVPEATLEIIEGDSVILTETTDADGTAEFSLFAGTYSVRFTKSGYGEDYENIVISDDTSETISVVGEMAAIPVEVEFFAQPASQQEAMEGISVTAYRNGEEIASKQTTNQGLVHLDLAYGDYRIVFSCEGFFDEEQYITVNGEGQKFSQLLVPKMASEDALEETVFLLLEWNGNYDLDICLFNSKLKQYVCARTPLDEYNNFIYSDNDGNQKYELLCLRNRFKEGAQTVYVVDVANAQAWEYSPMEADGFTIKIYTVDGVEVVSPQEEQNSPAWAAFYYEDGVRHDLNEYIYDETALQWTKDIKPVE